MQTHYKIVFSGKLLPGFDYDDVVANLVSFTSMDKEKARKFLSVSKPSLVKKNLTKAEAEKYHALFKKAGVQLQIVAPEAVQQKSETISPPPDTAYSSRAKPAESDSDNPYASPRADLKVNKAVAGDWLGRPKKVPPSRGWHWIQQAIGMFLAQPWKWIGMTLVMFLILIPVNMIPVVGFIPYTILSILFGGGLMIAAKSQSDGEPVEFNYIFKGFTHNRNQLVVLGVLYIAGFIAIGLIMTLMMGAGILQFMGIGSGDPQAATAALMHNRPMFLLVMLIGMLLYIPLVMAVWFASPLVAINDQGAWSACKLSLQGCLKNWLPFLLYGLVFLIFYGITFALIGGLFAIFFGVLGGGNTFSMILLPFVFMAVVGLPMMIITGLSIFTSYQDIYYKNS